MSRIADSALEPGRRSLAADLAELTKSRITILVVVTAAAGYLLASGDRSLWQAHFAWTLLGTALLAAGASALNQVLERDLDALMQRTMHRPLPAGRLDPDVALGVGAALVVAGLAVLVQTTNLLTAALGAATVLAYLFLYTPLKRKTSLATVVGAVPGAIPPMMGWAAVRDDVAPGAWALFGILFCWQLPHFLAIAWMYREDYARGGFPMLPVIDSEGRETSRQTVLWSGALLPVSLLPTVLGLAGEVYFVGALLLGLAFFAIACAFALTRSHLAARRLLLTSVAYLPALLAVLAIDRLVN
ncbi:MAG TPA: heme o synthase [Thermoanaerobaculia bacterium]|nr:heme o synthase [Thermoanaerobaculia bacterium]